MAYTTSPSCVRMGPLLQALLISMGLLLGPMVGGLAEEGPTGRGLELVHVEELMERSVERTRLRAEMRSAASRHGDGTAAAVDSHYEYLVEFNIGTDPVPFLAVPDTGSELVWTKQKNLCVDRRSTSFRSVSCSSSHSQCSMCNGNGKVCSFKQKYGHGARTATGYMASDALSLSRRKNTDGTDDETNQIYDVSIGCATYRDKGLLPKSADGIVGLNRGPMSLVQQLRLTSFSYCFSEERVRGRLWLGDGYSLDQLRAGPEGDRLQTTPLVDVEWTEAAEGETVVDASNMYYVQLEGISIGENFTYQSLPKERFKFRSKKDADKGVMFVDSGCSRTTLEKGIFEALLELLSTQELGDEVKPEEKPKEHKESTCFRSSGEKPWPEMKLYFHGAQMHLPWAKYTDQVQVAGKSPLFCLAIRGGSEMSILGNLQQRNTYMLYSLTKGDERLSFVQHFTCHPSSSAP